MRNALLSAVWLSLIPAVIASPSSGGVVVVFVDASLTSGANNGTSWPNAFQGSMGLQTALASTGANPAQIWLADGVYTAAGVAGSREASFQMKNGVAIYGGFAGGEASIDDRDPTAHPAVLSADFNNNDQPGGSGTADNSFHVVRAIACDATARLDGVIIEAGQADWSAPHDRGANLFILGGSPTIAGCVIRNGWASWGGGGMLVESATPHISNCTFIDNAGQHFGGAVFHTLGSAAVIEDCRFESNTGGSGAGLYSDGGMSATRPVVRHCEFINNKGLIGAGSGIGIFDIAGEPLIERCRFINNTTGAGGGGIYLSHSAAMVRECLFVGNVGQGDGGGAIYIEGVPAPGTGALAHPTIVNCVMVGNNGAVFSNFGGHVELVNCTIASNSAFQMPWPTILATGSSSIHLSNSIVWGNTPVFQPGLGGILLSIGMSSIQVDRCRVQLWNGSLPGTGTTGADPQFVDIAGTDSIAGTEDDDIRIMPGSPCIDAGDNSALPRGIDVDFLGQPRFVDDPATPDGGVGAAPLADIGAVEFQPVSIAGDVTGDSLVNIDDLLAVIGAWGFCAPPPGFCPADVTGNGEVNIDDLLMIINNWG